MICDLVTSCICDYVNTLRLFAVIVSLLQETLKRSKTCLVGAHLSSPFQMVIYLATSFHMNIGLHVLVFFMPDFSHMMIASSEYTLPDDLP